MYRKILGLAAAVAIAVVAVGFGTSQASAQAAPTANPGGPYSGVVGGAIQFNGAASTGVGLTFTWSFGDGTTANGVAPVKAYGAPGTYAVTLTVRDLNGFTSSVATTATISGFVQTTTFINTFPFGQTCFFINGVLVCNPLPIVPVFTAGSVVAPGFPMPWYIGCRSGVFAC